MMAVVDARYRFSYISVGAQGRASDAGVFAESDFKQALDSGLLNLPAAALWGVPQSRFYHITG